MGKRTVTNIYICNLAVADLLVVLICVPFKVSHDTHWFAVTIQFDNANKFLVQYPRANHFGPYQGIPIYKIDQSLVNTFCYNNSLGKNVNYNTKPGSYLLLPYVILDTFIRW